MPQLALLRHVDAVVCHGGHNTLCEALALGLQLVLAPVRDDHPLVADQVVAAGAGPWPTPWPPRSTTRRCARAPPA